MASATKISVAAAAAAGFAVAVLLLRRNATTKPTVRVGVSCLLMDPLTGKLVLGIRKNKDLALGDGTWHNPGGKVDVGESLKVACCRELLEEAGINAEPQDCRQIGTTNDVFGEGKHYVTLHFLIEWNEKTGGQPKRMEPDKCLGWKWMHVSEVLKLRHTGKLFAPLVNLLEAPNFHLPHGSRQTRLRRHCRGRVVFFIGYPGSGKGTQGKIIAKQLGIHHVSTGELFRAEVATGSVIGQQMDRYMKVRVLYFCFPS